MGKSSFVCTANRAYEADESILPSSRETKRRVEGEEESSLLPERKARTRQRPHL